MKKYSLIVIFAGLIGCNANPAPYNIKCSEGYNPSYKSTTTTVEFICVKNE